VRALVAFKEKSPCTVSAWGLRRKMLHGAEVAREDAVGRSRSKRLS